MTGDAVPPTLRPGEIIEVYECRGEWHARITVTGHERNARFSTRAECIEWVRETAGRRANDGPR